MVLKKCEPGDITTLLGLAQLLPEGLRPRLEVQSLAQLGLAVVTYIPAQMPHLGAFPEHPGMSPGMHTPLSEPAVFAAPPPSALISSLGW